MDENSKEPERFEMAFRLLGNEVLAFSILSESKRRAWIAISIIALVVLLAVSSQFIPLFTALSLL